MWLVRYLMYSWDPIINNSKDTNRAFRSFSSFFFSLKKTDLYIKHDKLESGVHNKLESNNVVQIWPIPLQDLDQNK